MEKSNQDADNVEFKSENVENTIFLEINKTKISFELLESQEYENVEVIPIKSDFFGKKDFLTLKKGIDLGLVEIKELEHESVNSVSCKNDSVTPLILIDGDEIIGAKQNRIMNESLLVPANTTLDIPVSCTEHGRWSYKGKSRSLFGLSDYSLNHHTRSRKSRAAYENRHYQSEVWDEISNVEVRSDFRSNTSALHDNYENSKPKQEEYLSKFHIDEGQNGVIFVVNGEFKGLELFYNHSIYKEYHDKIFKSYIIDAIANEKTENKLERADLSRLLDTISYSQFRQSESIGLGDNIKFSNDYGSGSALVYDDELVHMTFFKDII